jgi:hypothetical protein
MATIESAQNVLRPKLMEVGHSKRGSFSLNFSKEESSGDLSLVFVDG